MAHTISLTVLSPDNIILDVQKVMSVRVRLRGDTWLSIYPGHAPLIAELLPGKIVYSTDEISAELELSTGIMQVSKNQITVFTGGSHYSVKGDEERGFEEFDNLSRMLMQSLVATETNDSHPSVEE